MRTVLVVVDHFVKVLLLCKSSYAVNNLQFSNQLAFSSSLQVPIQVNKYLAYSDGMRVIESGKLSTHTPASDGLLFTELDR